MFIQTQPPVGHLVRSSTSTIPVGSHPNLLLDEIDDLGIMMNFARNQVIFCERDPAEYLYKVVSGIVRTCRFLADGRRQIDSLHFKSDIFGLAAGAEHHLFAEAATHCELIAVRRQALSSVAARRAELAVAMFDAATDELRKVSDHLSLLGRTSAAERIINYLRTLPSEGAGDIHVIPISRQDMADYLGLTIETVSRTMTQLEGHGLIELLAARRVRLCSMM
ncbi:helix-turn-helix domain-containing protein [Rhizobium metallidurans]|uniref:CRP/FNR family nitrogen fixation transcriptional regulator n=1 Tax=Rhizobium metallidurans TaxID=1265931 RepID=A0A7W6CRI1_9HYPH|nr:helix-turn-helix domain-containing protein [Rhizobium metallidurans]MBB3965882.1 CRP/FNR family nitrogen fixation transcriptional regulator [Rhizobium metallidurans]